MKKILMVVVALVVFPLVFALQANAQTVSTESAKAGSRKLTLKPYVSVGMAYGRPMNVMEHKMSGSMGYDVRIGAEILPILDVEAQYLSMGSFNYTYDGITGRGNPYHTEINFAISAVMINANLKYPLTVKGLEVIPYVTAGIGRAWANMDIKEDYPSLGLSFGDKVKDVGPCYKLGIGIKVTLLKNLYTYGEFVHFQANFNKGPTGIFDKVKLNGAYGNDGIAVGLGWKY